MAISPGWAVDYRSGASPVHETDEAHDFDWLRALDTLAEKFIADMALAASWAITCACVLRASMSWPTSSMFSRIRISAAFKAVLTSAFSRSSPSWKLRSVAALAALSTPASAV